jgi:hypothetical protein
MSESAPLPSPPNPPPAERLPGDLVRAVRLFHALDQAGLAESFQVSVRTVIRWEQRGIDPELLPVDQGAKQPKWRKLLILWMLARYRRTASPDTRKTESTCITSTDPA